MSDLILVLMIIAIVGIVGNCIYQIGFNNGRYCGSKRTLERWKQYLDKLEES